MNRVHTTRIGVVFCLSMALLGCSVFPEDGVPSPSKPTIALEPVKGDLRPASRAPDRAPMQDPQVVAYAKRVRYVAELFPPERLVFLDRRSEASIGDPLDILYQGRRWFILDGATASVQVFEDDGTFVGMLGAKGEGPGEYVEALSLSRAYDGQVAVMDAARASILVYSVDGRFVRELDIRQHRLGFVSGTAFRWRDPHRIHAVGISASSGPYQAVIVDHADARPNVHALLQPRSKASMRLGGSWDYRAMALVGDTLWAGEPYTAHIDLYDGSGNLVKQVNRRRRGGLNEAWWHDFKRGDTQRFRELLTARRPVRIHPLDPFVLVDMNAKADLFTYAGEEIVLDLDLATMPTVYDGWGTRIVSVLPENEKKHHFNAYDYALLKEGGWTEDNANRWNLILRIGRLAAPPRL